jgi:hypothetical protein
MLCKDSWIDLSWDGLPTRQGPENIAVKINRRAKELLPFNTACNRVAEEIYSTHKNLYVTMSGGSDSENVANTFLRMGIPFTPIMITYDATRHNDQKLEMWWAQQWCKKNNIKPLVVDVGNYANSKTEKQYTSIVKPRLGNGTVTHGLILDTVQQLNGHIVSGFQLEYYPDHEQMEYLRPVLGNYNGFVMEEADLYVETLVPNQHPWAFYYWNAEIMASFVSEWDTTLTMQENKAKIYGTVHRPKFVYHRDVFEPNIKKIRDQCKQHWGTRDCALLGSKEQLLAQLLG